jgi:oligopeptide/dipeptide ABC transporter ATP-binding protein
MIALALCAEPVLLIADEPTTALDVTMQAEILDLLRDLRREFSLSLLLITHDLGVVAETADRVAVMYGGRIVEEATVGTLFRAPAHPYTRGLLACVPDGGGARLAAIPGAVPALGHFPGGCAFSPRCASRRTACAELPPLIDLAPDQHVRCVLYSGASTESRT